MSAEQPDKLVIWRFYDGRPGHDNQTFGLVNALSSLEKTECYNLEAPATGACLFSCLTKSFPAGKSLPKPDLIIGAGHKTHLALLVARKIFGGNTVVVMRPTLPADWFDLCVIPDHDKPPIKANIFITHGAINNISPGNQHNDKMGLILIGGPSKHCDWNTDLLIQQLETLMSRTPETVWQIADSGRTPEETRDLLGEFSEKKKIVYMISESTPAEWIAKQLEQCGTVWVTADSISMIYESLTAGAKTGILPVPQNKKNKIDGVINELDRARMITRYSDWLSGQEFRLPPGGFNEALRTASEIIQRFHYKTGRN